MTQPRSLRARALALLARREHTRAELRGRLAGGEGEAAEGEVEALLDELALEGYLSDARFAEQFARRHGAVRGPLRIDRDLRARGVGEQDREAVLAPIREQELENAAHVLRRKFPAPPADAAEWARQGRYLQNRGFSPGVIRRVLRSPQSEDGQ